jgi:hypothetical protein
MQPARMSLDATKTATRAAGGSVSTASYRDPASGEVAYGVRYASRGAEWRSHIRCADRGQVDLAVQVLAEFIGARRE